MNKSRILVVDDEPALSTLVRTTLEETRLYEVMVENRSGQALATARSFRPHVVLLDIDMPGKGGGEVATEIRSDPDLGGTPILFFTSLLSPQEADAREPSAGGERFVAKSANPAVLIRTIESVLTAAPAQS